MNPPHWQQSRSASALCMCAYVRYVVSLMTSLTKDPYVNNLTPYFSHTALIFCSGRESIRENWKDRVSTRAFLSAHPRLTWTWFDTIPTSPVFPRTYLQASSACSASKLHNPMVDTSSGCVFVALTSSTKMSRYSFEAY